MAEKIYLIGSLRNPAVPVVADQLRAQGFEVFDDWFAAGHEADEWLQRYEQNRGHSYREALRGHAVNHVFHFDEHHLDDCDMAVMLLPAGKSAHLELGYVRGQGKPAFIWMPNGEPERWDVMYRFATDLVYTFDELIEAIRKERNDE